MKKIILISGFILSGWVGLLCLASWWQDQAVVWPVSRHFWQQSQVLGERTYVATDSGQLKSSLGIVYGFLPYWHVDDYQIHPAVSDVSYFRLAVNGRGEIVTASGDGGYPIYQSERIQQIFDQITRQNLRLDVTFFTSQSDDIYQLVTSVEAQQTLIDNILQVVQDDRLDGVNLDFEFLGTLDDDERQAWTMFIYRLKNALNSQAPRTKLSIDVYGSAVNMSHNLWDFPKIGKIVDRVMVMGYDYKTRRSSIPGPSSPTLGKEIWGGDIWEDIRLLARYVPSEKIVLIVPFYGYAWETTTCELATAKTHPNTGETMTYRGAQNILADSSLNAHEYWDDKSLTPYLVYRPNEEDNCRIGFFENTRSLTYKIDLIEKLHLGGIGIWALGYEGEHQELWEVIAERF